MNANRGVKVTVNKINNHTQGACDINERKLVSVTADVISIPVASSNSHNIGPNVSEHQSSDININSAVLNSHTVTLHFLTLIMLGSKKSF